MKLPLVGRGSSELRGLKGMDRYGEVPMQYILPVGLTDKRKPYSKKSLSCGGKSRRFSA